VSLSLSAWQGMVYWYAWWHGRHGKECINSALFNQAYVQVSCHQQGVMNSGCMTRPLIQEYIVVVYPLN